MESFENLFNKTGEPSVGSFNVLDQIYSNDYSVTIRVPSEMMRLQGAYQAELIKQPARMFMDCSNVTIEPEYYELTYEKTPHYYNLLEKKRHTEAEKLLLLLNIGQFLERDNRKYSTYFDPRNIYISDAYEVLFAFRILPDTVGEGLKTEAEELEEYKALILSILQKKYSFLQLMDVGIDILESKTQFQPIIQAASFGDVKELLLGDYRTKYLESKSGRMAFKVRTVKLFAMILSVIILGMGTLLSYFAYRSINETTAYERRMNLLLNHYNRNPYGVEHYANQLEDNEMDDTIKLVAADSLIAIATPENLERAFYLDPSRQIEIIELLVEQGEFDMIAGLRSDKAKVQLYQYFYAGDFQRVLTLVNANLDLQYDAQAQILLAQAYMNLGDYITAAQISEQLNDKALQLEVYTAHREYVVKNETNIETRTMILETLDQIIELLQDDDTQ